MKKKNFLWSMMALTVAAVLSVGFTACGGDDDDEGGSGGGSGSPKSGVGVLDKKSGLRLKSVGDYTYYYNNKGLIDYIADKSDRYEFSYNPNKIYVVDNYDKDDESLSVSYNGSGYLSAISYSFERDKTEGLWSESANPNGRTPPSHLPFLRVAAFLSRMRSPMISRSYCANVISMFSIIRPALVAVLISCVTATSDTPHWSN